MKKGKKKAKAALQAQLDSEKPDFTIVVDLIQSGAHLGDVRLAEKPKAFKINVLLALAFLTGVDEAVDSKFVSQLRLQSKMLAQIILETDFESLPADKRFALLPTKQKIDFIPTGEAYRDLLINIIIFKGTVFAKAFDSDADSMLRNSRSPPKQVDAPFGAMPPPIVYGEKRASLLPLRR